MKRLFTLAVAAVCFCGLVRAQGNYEVQVYGSDLVPVGSTMLELHSNFTAKGAEASDGLLATNHAEHETVEVTHGFSEWFETGFYLFTSIQPDGSWKFVGTHIRPRVSIPERYHLPVGLSLSSEIGYQRAIFSPDTWTWEIRPIVDKTMGRFYWAVNPTVGVSFHGPGKSEGPDFEPNVKVSYDVTHRVAAGLEYYAVLGPITNFAPAREQEHDFLPAIDLNLGSDWEFNFGVGVGVTQATDHLLIKMILGHRFHGREGN